MAKVKNADKKSQPTHLSLLRFNKIIIPTFLSIILFALLVVNFELLFADKFFPRVFIGDAHLVFLTKSQALQLISGNFNKRKESKIELTSEATTSGKTYSIDLSQSSAALNTDKAIEEAFALGHQGSWSEKMADQLKILIFGATITPEVELALGSQQKQLEDELLQAPLDASLTVTQIKESTTSAVTVNIVEGKNGLGLDSQKLNEDLKKYLSFGKAPKSLPIKVIYPKVTNEKVYKAKNYLETISQTPLKLKFQDQIWTIDAQTLIGLLDLTTEESLLDEKKLDDYLLDIEKSINQPVVEALFNFNPDTKRVTEFKPGQEGRKLNTKKAKEQILLSLDQKKGGNLDLPIDVTKPKTKTADVNDLGINELLGQGVSHFAGSIPNRAYNVALTASKINGVLIAPGEVFSFNATVGDPVAANGFKQAYVIKSGRTVLDDGGGVCQDSTTVFRAALNAGLPILERTAHAYRVAYYEQGFPPGLDATTYYPTVDLKFKNDTPAHILIQAYIRGTTLFVDLYGTKDERVTTLTKPVITNQTPPPPELRQDDPTLPKGEVKQVDWSAWGANVSFKRTVTRGSETIINETWRSNYRPWQAVYLVGTKEN